MVDGVSTDGASVVVSELGCSRQRYYVRVVREDEVWVWPEPVWTEGWWRTWKVIRSASWPVETEVEEEVKW